jgi:hypothetical protein
LREPAGSQPKRGVYDRRPISEFSARLANNHPDRIRSATIPILELLAQLIDTARDAGAIDVGSSRRVGVLVLRTVMCSWFGKPFVEGRAIRITAEDTWDFCLYGIHGFADSS